MNNYNFLIDFCERCSEFKEVYRRNRQNYCKDCLPLIGIAVPKPVEIPETEKPKRAPRKPYKPAKFSHRLRLPYRRVIPTAKAPIIPKKRVYRAPSLELVEGSLTALLFEILQDAPVEGVRSIEIKEAVKIRGFATKTIRSYLSLLAKQRRIYSRPVYARGHLSHYVYSLKPLPKLIPGEPVRNFLEVIALEPKSVPWLSEFFGCSRTNIKHLYNRARKKGFYVQESMKKNTRYYYLPPYQAKKLL